MSETPIFQLYSSEDFSVRYFEVSFVVQDTYLPFPDATSYLLNKFSLTKTLQTLLWNTEKFKKGLKELHLSDLLHLPLLAHTHLCLV